MRDDEPIPRLVLRLSLPVSTGLLFQTLFNVTDSWAAGRISVDALAALSASFPVFFLMVSASHGGYAAANALLSHALGRRDENAARAIVGQALLFSLWMGVLVGIAGILALPRLLDLLRLEGSPRHLAACYLGEMLWGTPLFTFASTCNGLLSAHGDTRPFRDSLIVGFLLNIVFDIWFVFGGLGLPSMGFPGIARATLLIQALTALFMFTRVRAAGLYPPGGLIHLHPRARVQRRLIAQGFPAVANMLTITLGLFVYTAFAARFGEQVLAALGTAMRVEQLALLPAIGLNTASMTLAGRSLGAARLDRLWHTYRTCLGLGFLCWIVGAPLVAIPAANWMTLFTKDPEVIATGASILRVSMLTFYGYVILFTTTSMLQGLQRPLYAIWIGIYRQFIAPMLLIPSLMLTLTPPESAIWWGAFGSVWSGALITLLYLRLICDHIRRDFTPLAPVTPPPKNT